MEDFEDFNDKPDLFKNAQPETEKNTDVRSLFSKTMSVVMNIAFYLVLVALIGGSTLFAVSNDPQKSCFGYRFYNVLTNSMDSDKPGSFRAGDVIIVKIADASEVEKGDIITFVPGQDARSTLTHRVVDIKTDLNGVQGTFFVTRGDTNNTDDPPISSNMLIGKKVFSIPHAGTVLKFIRTNLIAAIISILAAFMLILLLRYYFAAPKGNRIQLPPPETVPEKNVQA